MRKPIFIFLLPIFFFSSFGFAGKYGPPKLPKNLKKHGLVIFQLGPDDWKKAKIKLGRGKARDTYKGFFIKKLRKGKYHLKTIEKIVGITRVGSFKTKSYHDVVTLNKEFEIQAGKITNLGLLYLSPDTKKKKVNVFAFKNHKITLSFLKDHYPELSQNLKKEDFIFSPQKYSNARIKEIQKFVLYQSLTPRKRESYEENDIGRVIREQSEAPILYGKRGLFWGELGTLGRYSPKTKKQKARFDFYKTGSVGRIVPLSYSGKKYFFLTEDGQIRVLKEGKVYRRTSPKDFIAKRGAVFGKSGIVLVDRRFNIAVSFNGGKSWKKYQDYSVAEELLKGNFTKNQKGIYVFAHDSYFSNLGVKAVYIDFITQNLRPIDLPTPYIMLNSDAILETKAGLYFQVSSYKRTTLFFRAKNSQEWVERKWLGYDNCVLKFPGGGGKVIQASCGVSPNFVSLISRDFGETWKKQ